MAKIPSTKTKPIVSRFPVTPTPVVTVTPPVPTGPPTFVYDPDMLDDDLTVTSMDNGYEIIVDIDYDDCATLSGSQALQTWLAAQTNPILTTIVMGGPLFPPTPGNQDVQSSLVPWIQQVDSKGVPLGSLQNVGGLIDNFTALPYSVAVATVLNSFTISLYPQQ